MEASPSETRISQTKSNRLASILKTILDICWYGSITIGILGLIAIPLSGQMMQGKAAFPKNITAYVELNSMKGTDLPITEWANLPFSISGQLVFFNSYRNSWLFGLLTTMLLFIPIIWGIYLLRGFFKTVKQGQPFNPSNPRRLTNLGLVVIGGEIVRTVVHYFEGSFFIPHLKETSVVIKPWIEFRFEVIFLALVIIVIAKIFELGARLQDEHELTV